MFWDCYYRCGPLTVGRLFKHSIGLQPLHLGLYFLPKCEEDRPWLKEVRPGVRFDAEYSEERSDSTQTFLKDFRIAVLQSSDLLGEGTGNGR